LTDEFARELVAAKKMLTASPRCGRS
jgi:hypothetical protein